MGKQGVRRRGHRQLQFWGMLCFFFCELQGAGPGVKSSSSARASPFCALTLSQSVTSQFLARQVSEYHAAVDEGRPSGPAPAEVA